MKFTLIIPLLFSVLIVTAQYQDPYYIELSKDKIRIKNKGFYISEVIDDRSDKTNIGFVQKGISNRVMPAALSGGLTDGLKTYLDFALEREEGDEPIVMRVKRLQVSEETKLTKEYGYVDFYVSYYCKGIEVLRKNERTTISDLDVTIYHEANIRKAVALTLESLSEVDWKHPESVQISPVVESSSASHYSNHQSPVSNNPLQKAESENRNVTAVGYQIGGFCLIGIDYEVRVADYFGIHFGGGLFGLTGGVKVHTNPEKNSGFFNLSFKDGGFGGVGTAGVEYGGRWVFF